MCDNGKNVYVPEPCVTVVSRKKHFEIDVESQYNNALCNVLTDPVTTTMEGPQYVYKNRSCVPALQTHCVGNDALIPWEFTLDYMVALDETEKTTAGSDTAPWDSYRACPPCVLWGKSCNLSYTLLLLQAMHYWEKPFSVIFSQILTRLYSSQLTTSDIGFQGFQNCILKWYASNRKLCKAKIKHNNQTICPICVWIILVLCIFSTCIHM